VKRLTLIPFLLLATAFAQHGSNWPTPPPPADRSVNVQGPAASSPTRVAADPVQLQREAKELLELSQSLQPDVASVSHGLLPKDTLDKLKRIEKLAKHLRGELNP